MDTLKNKTYESYNYLNRYTDVPYYYDTIAGRYVYGIGSQVVKEGVQYVSHKVLGSDTLEYLALKYYGNPLYW